jgi:hypothetical protein
MFIDRAVDHAFSWKATHTYNGWPGKKLVRVKGESGCVGNVTKEIAVGIGPTGREDYRLGFVPNSMICNPVPNMPPIRTGTGVRIETDGRTITYGQAGTTFNASGSPSLPVPPSYRFPDQRKYSLVYRIGSQLVQGEAGAVVFTANQTAPLEICVNDNPSFLTDNSGGMLITIMVNERSAQ